MNDFENRNSDGDEITRIQNEIDKVLNTPPVTEPQIINNEAFKPETFETKTSETAIPETETFKIETHEEIVSIEPTTAAAPAHDAPVFYRETIKNEDKSKPRTGFNRIVAILMVICLLGGTGAGLLVGMNIPTNKNNPQTSSKDGKTAETVDVSSKANDENTVKNTNEESAFAFNNSVKPTVPANGNTDSVDLKAMSGQFVDIINKVEPSVVGITTTMSTIQSSSQDPGIFMIPNEQPIGSGSGIIFHEDGEKVYIVTNHHVISNASGVRVSIADSEPVTAKLVGSDAEADLAVISVTKSDLKKANVDSIIIAEFGDSDEVQVGEMVLAIGNALGEGNTTTFGLISTKEKQIKISSHEAPLTVIQTSAAINFGNSGGPLVNMDGEIIGINTAKLSPASGVEGMGYSITSNKAKPIIEGFMNRANKPFLGISGKTLTQDISTAYNLPEAGVFVNAVFADSSAAQAGIKRTDIITAIDGEAIFTMEQLSEYIKNCQIGDKVEIQLIRDGKTPMTIIATLTKYNDTDF